MRIAIFGAGSTGCYLAAQLVQAGLDVSIICRERIKQAVEDNNGITITDYLGHCAKVMPSQLITQVSGQLYDVVFVTLKCHHLSEAIADIKTITDEKSVIVFMQNGLGSIELIKEELIERRVYTGITPFNVLQKTNATFHKGTEGHFIFERFPGADEVKKSMAAACIDCELALDMKPVVYGKLLLNLNNAINAIVDLPIKQELEDKSLRRVLASAMKEWLSVCEALDIELARFTVVKPKLIPTILRLPNWLFKIAAKKMLDIDPQARSSMWEDIQASRKTEIEFLNKQVVALGEKVNVATPVNQLIVKLIRQLESGEKVAPEQLADGINYSGS